MCLRVPKYVKEKLWPIAGFDLATCELPNGSVAPYLYYATLQRCCRYGV